MNVPSKTGKLQPVITNSLKHPVTKLLNHSITNHPTSNIQHLTPGIQHPASDTQHLSTTPSVPLRCTATPPREGNMRAFYKISLKSMNVPSKTGKLQPLIMNSLTHPITKLLNHSPTHNPSRFHHFGFSWWV